MVSSAIGQGPVCPSPKWGPVVDISALPVSGQACVALPEQPKHTQNCSVMHSQVKLMSCQITQVESKEKILILSLGSYSGSLHLWQQQESGEQGGWDDWGLCPAGFRDPRHGHPQGRPRPCWWPLALRLWLMAAAVSIGCHHAIWDLPRHLGRLGASCVLGT